MEKKNFAKIPNRSKESDIAIELINNNRLAQSYYNDLKEGGRFSKLSLINKCSELLTDSIPKLGKLRAMVNAELITKKDEKYLTKAFNENEKWHKHTRRLFTKLYFLKLELQKESFKSTMLENLIEEGYKFEYSEQDKLKFLNGGMYIDQILSSEKRIWPTNYPKTIEAKPSDIIKEIRSIIEPILNRLKIDYIIEEDIQLAKITVVQAKNQYVIDFRNKIKSSKKTNYSFLEIDADLVHEWLFPILQILADQKSNKLVGVGDWSHILIPSLEFNQYEKFTSKYPELKLVKNQLYIIEMNKEELNEFSFSNHVEFHYSDDNEHHIQHKFHSMLSPTKSFQKYITTTQKNMFLDHIKKFKKEYKLSASDITAIKNNLISNTIIGIENAILLLPKEFRKLTVENDFPQINPEKNSFSEVFPKLNKFIKGNFKAKNLSVDPLSPYILEMEFEGRKVGLKKTSYSEIQSLIRFINKLLRKKGAGLYTSYHGYSTWNGHPAFIYLLDEQKNELEEIFNYRYTLSD